MPVMVRPKGKATKIAYKVLGIPAPQAHKKSAIGRKNNQRLLFEETARAR